MPDPTLNQLKELWQLRLSNARLRAQFTHNYVIEVQRDLQEGAVPLVDGNFALERAVRAENLALAEYNLVLLIFTALVVDGMVPDEGIAGGEASSAHGQDLRGPAAGVD